MKYFIAMILTIMTISANAAECKLPKDCKYLDSEFSTAGGDKVSYIMEVTCEMPNQKIIKYTDWEISAGSLFGIGRLTAPNKIIFSNGTKDKLECDY